MCSCHPLTRCLPLPPPLHTDIFYHHLTVYLLPIKQLVLNSICLFSSSASSSCPLLQLHVVSRPMFTSIYFLIHDFFKHFYSSTSLPVKKLLSQKPYLEVIISMSCPLFLPVSGLSLLTCFFIPCFFPL